MRSWLVVTVVAVLFIGGIVCGVIAWPSSRPGPPSPTASYARVPDFHATPRPAHATTIAMDFATRPRPGTGPATPGPPAVPFTQCAGAGRGCGELIQGPGRASGGLLAAAGQLRDRGAVAGVHRLLAARPRDPAQPLPHLRFRQRDRQLRVRVRLDRRLRDAPATRPGRDADRHPG